MNFKNLVYALCSISFSVIIGGAIYEHLAVIPGWSAAPPASLSMFQGEYGLKPEAFWMYIHPVTLLLFIVSLIVHWKTDRRKNILITLGGYVLTMIATMIYYVPELVAITGTTFSDEIDPDLTMRAGTWEMLSILRLVFIIVLAVVLNTGLTKSEEIQQ